MPLTGLYRADTEKEAQQSHAQRTLSAKCDESMDTEIVREREFRKKMATARRKAEMTQKEIGEISGLPFRAISRLEKNTDISPTVRTVIKYLTAIGYELDVVKSTDFIRQDVTTTGEARTTSSIVASGSQQINGYSGNFPLLLPIPKPVYRKLVAEAQEDEVDLYIYSLLKLSV